VYSTKHSPIFFSQWIRESTQADRDILEAERWAEEEVSPASISGKGIPTTSLLPVPQDQNKNKNRPHSSNSRARRAKTESTPTDSSTAGTVGSARAAVPREQWLELGSWETISSFSTSAEEYVVEFSVQMIPYIHMLVFFQESAFPPSPFKPI